MTQITVSNNLQILETRWGVWWVRNLINKQHHYARLCDSTLNKWVIKRNYLLGLFRSDILALQEDVVGSSSELDQFQSHFALLFNNEDYFYTIVPDVQQECTLRDIEKISNKRYIDSKSKESVKHLVYSNDVII